MLYGQGRDLPDVVVDTVDHLVVTAPRAVQPAEAEPERLPSRRGFAATEPYRNSTAAVATFSGSRASARRAGAAQAIAKSPSLTGQR
jgi:hypothetical protein